MRVPKRARPFTEFLHFVQDRQGKLRNDRTGMTARLQLQKKGTLTPALSQGAREKK